MSSLKDKAEHAEIVDYETVASMYEECDHVSLCLSHERLRQELDRLRKRIAKYESTLGFLIGHLEGIRCHRDID